MNSGFRWIGKSTDGEFVTLRKFNGQFTLADYATPDWIQTNKDKIRTGVVIDTETTGLNRNSDLIIEIGLRAFQFNRGTGEILAIGEEYSGLQDPNRPLSDDVKRLTGLTDEALRGQSIDWTAVDRILDSADIIIAHNASFDRPFVDRSSKVSAGKPWACSFKQIDWTRKGFGVSKLEILSIYHGFFTDAHRALHDAEALLHLMSMTDWNTQRPYFNELLANARRPITKVVAANSPFESKDALKERGYNWEANRRAWQKMVFKEDLDAELAWLESAVYKGSFRPVTEDIATNDNFKA
jgi:DNA polymerase-3 subunit epsilon